MKKIIALLLTVVLTASVAISGTVAYLQAEDSDVNVMTMGNVKIEQHEYERVVDENGNYEKTTVTTKSGSTVDSYKVREFTQAKPLLPSVGTITGWDDTSVRWEQLTDSLLAVGGQRPFTGLNNVQDKFVLVENTGKSDAYVRTLIALEYGSNTKDIVGLSTGDFRTWNGIGVVAINGNNYYVYEAIYKGADGRHVGGVLPAGEYTYNSLGQIYLANEATNEDCEALDGNDNGTYDILVLSQAVQVQGFENAQTALDTAFGATNAANIQTWFADVTIPTVGTPGDETPPADPNATGSITPAYTRADGIWGEGRGSAKRSFVVKIYSGDTYMGSTSLNNIGGIIDGDVYVTWSIDLNATSNDDSYWSMNWEVAPSKDVQPTRAELWIDGTKVDESAVQLNGPDALYPITGAVIDANGKILRYVVEGTDANLQAGETLVAF